MKHLLFIAVIFLSAGPLGAATYYVSTSGNDGNACTNGAMGSAARRHVSQGIACLSSGDTLRIQAGTYTTADDRVNTFYNSTNGRGFPSGSSGAPTIIEANPGDAVMLAPNDGVQFGVGFIGNGYSWITVRNLSMDGTCTQDTDFKVDQTATNIVFSGNDLKGAALNNLLWTAPAGTISGNTLHDTCHTVPAGTNICGTPCGYGLYVNFTTTALVIDGNTFYRNSLYGLHHYPNGGDPQGTTIRNNTFHDNGIDSAAPDIILYGSNHKVFNNVFYSTASGGVERRAGSGTVFYNNTFYNEGTVDIQAAIRLRSSVSGDTVRNNLAITTPGFLEDTVGANTINTNITTGTAGSHFVNAAGADFHLVAGSSARDTGATIGAVTADKDGVPRPQPPGGSYDVGAYEFVTSSVGQPPIEDFVYTTGTVLAGQAGGQFWTAGWQLNATNNFIADVGPVGFPNDGNAARCPGTTSCDNTRTFNVLTTGPVSGYVRTDDCSPTAGGFGTTMGMGLDFVTYVQIQNGKFRIYDGSGSGFTDFADCTPNAAHRIDIDFDPSHPNQYRARVDNGTYSSYFTVIGGSSSSFSTVEIFNLSTNSNLFWVDAIGVDVPAANKLKFTAQPLTSIIQGQNIGTVNVSVMDSTNNVVVTTSSASITLAKNAGCPGGMTLTSGTSLTKSATQGVATWTDLVLDGTTGDCSIDASSSGLTGVTSSSVTVTSTAPPVVAQGRPRIRGRIR